MWWDAETDIQPKHEKSNWATGPKGEYDGVPRKYLESKKDDFLDDAGQPWDDK